jgi:GcrA cell cycle regulator
MTIQAVDWNDENTETLKRMYAAGAPASEIASCIRGATRNAVVGKAHRLNLASRKDVGSGGERIKNGKTAAKIAKGDLRKKPTTHNITRLQSIKNGSDPGLADVLTDDADCKGVALLELTNETCRWPLGPTLLPAEIFCGEPTANLFEHRPYCPFHHRRGVDPTAIRNPKAFQRSAERAAGD